MFKKNLALVLAVCMLFGMISVTGIVRTRAEGRTVVITFADLFSSDTNLGEITSNDYVNLTFSKASGSSAPKYYSSSGDARVYAKNTIKVETKSGVSEKITKITFTTVREDTELTADVGTYTKPSWEGEANSILFTASASGQIRITKMTIVLGDGGASTPEPTPFVKPTTPEDIVNAAYGLAVGATLEGGSYTLTGKVTAINTAYSSQHGNVTVTIVVDNMTDKPIQCFRMKNGSDITAGEGVEVVAEGDTITVTGSLKNYNGIIEFDAACTLDSLVPGETPFVRPETPEDIVNAAYGLAQNTTLGGGNYTLTGEVTAVNTEYSSQHGNVTVTIVVGDMTDKPIQCYRMVNGSGITAGEGVEIVAAGDTITVTGSLKNYNGTVEFDAGCTLDERTAGGTHYQTPEEILEAANALDDMATLPGGPYELTGVVTEIITEYSERYGNITFKMSVLDYEIEGYRIKNSAAFTDGDGVEILDVGDTVTIKGNIQKYNGIIEFVQNSTLEDIEYIAKVIRASLILQENLDINFRLITDQFDAATDEIGLKVVLNGKTTVCEGEVDDENDKQYIYTFENITPALMADEMTVSVLVNGETVHEITYSVAEYCYKLLRQTDNATLKTLLVDLLIYGAKSQLYINHNVDNLADKGLTEDELDFATQDEDFPELENLTDFVGLQDDPIYTIKSAGLNLTDGIIIRLKFVLNEGKEHSATASLAVNQAIEGLFEETSVPGTYYAYFKIENPANFSQWYQFYAVNKGALAPGLSNILKFSAESYCASILAKCADGRITDEALKDIVVALVKYAYSVKAYADIVNN